MIEELGLHHPLLSRYEAAAHETFSQNAYRFSEAYVGKDARPRDTREKMYRTFGLPKGDRDFKSSE